MKTADGKWLKADGTTSDTEVKLTIKDGFTYDSTAKTFTKTFTDIPVGKYTVTETDTAVTGYDFKGVTYNGGTEPATVDVTKTTAGEVNIVDKY